MWGRGFWVVIGPLLTWWAWLGRSWFGRGLPVSPGSPRFPAADDIVGAAAARPGGQGQHEQEAEQEHADLEPERALQRGGEVAPHRASAGSRDPPLRGTRGGRRRTGRGWGPRGAGRRRGGARSRSCPPSGRR